MNKDLEALKLVNEHIMELEKELKFYQEWKDVMLECAFVHQHNQELLSRAKKED